MSSSRVAGNLESQRGQGHQVVGQARRGYRLYVSGTVGAQP